ncbi:hypothetical protein MMC15_007997 [Xylographa vitiligo]|nr:hypothetical protein [Xylographa vitiligo]
MAYQNFHFPSSHPPPSSPLPSSFTLTCPPNTDLWRIPPAHDVFTAPFLFRSISLSSFRHARVSISADWKTLFDQGGLCMILPISPQKDDKSKWIKTGIEFYNGAPNVSTVACDRWADWSLSPLPEGDTKGVTIGMEREVLDGNATSVLVVYVIEGYQKRHVREISWVFEGVEESEKECGSESLWPNQQKIRMLKKRTWRCCLKDWKLKPFRRMATALLRARGRCYRLRLTISSNNSLVSRSLGLVFRDHHISKLPIHGS